MARNSEKTTERMEEPEEIRLEGVVALDPLSPDHFLLSPKLDAYHYYRIPKPTPSNLVSVKPVSALKKGGPATVRVVASVLIEVVQKSAASFFTGAITRDLLRSAFFADNADNLGNRETYLSTLPTCQ